MKRCAGEIIFAVLLLFSGVCPLAAGLLFLLAAGVGLVGINL